MAMDRDSRVIGIDVGSAFGSGIRGALVSSRASLLATRETITPRTGAEDLINTLVSMAGQLVELAGRDGQPASALGLAVPGLIDEDAGVVHRSPNLMWQEVELRRVLENRLGLKVFLVQDARAGALAENILGTGRGVSDMILVVVGTGVGCSVISDGRFIRGAHGTAGEIGHISVDSAGLTCGCGGRGCVETFASEPSLARRYTLATREVITAAEVISRAMAGHPPAVRVWNEALGALATVIATAVVLTDCELVVLSGTMAIPSAALVPLRTVLTKRINLIHMPRVELGTLGDNAGILGAAAVAFEHSGLAGVIRGWGGAG
jgi:glucokinase